jgi:FMN phosphatase YigB (HAD superfamily)
MWPKLSQADKALTTPLVRDRSYGPSRSFVFFDAGMVIVDLDWDAFVEGVASHYAPGGFAADRFRPSILQSGLLSQWESGQIGPAQFVAQFTELMHEAQTSTGSLRNPPTMLDIKSHSSKIIAAIRPQVLETVALLKKLGYGTGILSNASPWHETDLLLKADFAPLFDVVLFSQDLGVAKPNPEIYTQAEACAQFHARERNTTLGQPDLVFHRFYFVDDTPVNIRAAQAAGWRASLVDLLRSPELWEAPDLERVSRQKHNLVFGEIAAQRVNSLLKDLTQEAN